MVYIAEAHAADVWPINSTRCRGPANSVLTPHSLDARCAIAQRMLEDLPVLAEVPVYVDGLEDTFLEAYAAWPIRMFAVRGGRIERIASPQSATFELCSFREWLLAATEARAGQPALDGV